MTELIEKNIILGISEDIATYKTIDIIRYIKEKGTKVKLIMTKYAKKFIIPLSLKTISCHPVLDNFINSHIATTIPHIKLAKWSDLFLLAPAATTANLLTRLAMRLANDLLCSVCLAITNPITVAPSMNQKMYKTLATQTNLNFLLKRGVLIWTNYGYQTCNDIDSGRMEDPKILTEYVDHYFFHDHSLSHLNIMVTAGPTHKALDPIRFFTTNYNSEKMGFAIAQSAVDTGAKVTLITGPVHLCTPAKVRHINVTSDLDMQQAVMQDIKNQQIFIICTAISNYRICHTSLKKIKKKQKHFKKTMIKNTDIISEVDLLIDKQPYVGRFASETNNIKNYAHDKHINNKNLDLICTNNIDHMNQEFNSVNNALYLFWNKGGTHITCNKKLLAKQLINEIINSYNDNH